MELRDLIRVVTRRWWLLVAGTVLAVVASYVALRFLAPWPLYQATSTVLIGGSSDLDWSSLQLGRDLAPTYVEWTKRRPVLQGAINALDLDMSFEELQGQIDVRAIRDTQLMEIAVTAEDPEKAAAIANEVAWQLTLQPLPIGGDNDPTGSSLQGNVEQLKRRIESAEAELVELGNRLAVAQSEEDVAALTARIAAVQGNLDVWRNSFSELGAVYSDYLGNFIAVAEEAVPPSQPLKPLINVAVAGITGLVLAIGLAFLLEQLDNTVKTHSDVVEYLSVPALGVVTPLNGLQPRGVKRLLQRHAWINHETVGLRTTNLPHPDNSYRRLVANITHANDGPLEGTILVTSPTEGNGHAKTALALAMAWATTGQKTILVDASLHHPVLHTYLGLPNETGLVNLLNGSRNDENLMLYNPIGKDGLKVVTSGPVEDVSPEVLFSKDLEVGLDELAENADVVLVNGPTVLAGPEAANLAAQVDYVLLVLDARKTRIEEAQEAVALLKAGGGTNVVGVLNSSE
jgi:succinoglycan biosynthesis transport protein ExoP